MQPSVNTIFDASRPCSVENVDQEEGSEKHYHETQIYINTKTFILFRRILQHNIYHRQTIHGVMAFLFFHFYILDSCHSLTSLFILLGSSAPKIALAYYDPTS